MSEKLDLEEIEARSHTVAASSQSPWRQIQLDLRALVARIRVLETLLGKVLDEEGDGGRIHWATIGAIANAIKRPGAWY